MSHILSRSFRVPGDSIRGRERLVSKAGKILGEYDTIAAANKAGQLISATSETKPKPKPNRLFNALMKKAYSR